MKAIPTPEAISALRINIAQYTAHATELMNQVREMQYQLTLMEDQLKLTNALQSCQQKDSQ